MNPQTLSSQPGRFRHLAIALGLALAVLAGCGGGSTSSNSSKTSSNRAGAAMASSPMPTQAQTQALFKHGAQLNAAELTRAAESTASFPALSKAGTKSGAQLVAVYRFYNTLTQAHFYTASESEKATVLATMPQLSLDGPAFYASSSNALGLSPVHRFFNTQTGVHFYTISDDEKHLVQSSMPQLTYDGVAYYASKVKATQLAPLYRFFFVSKGFHFYSNSEAERDSIVANLPQYQLEGTGYYVMQAPGPSAPQTLPHSGFSAQQCYEAGTHAVVDCGSAGAGALNAQQDGHRTSVNAMSYSEVPMVTGGTYARTECVKDNVTGLTWEGKTASGLRAGSNGYTNYDDPSQAQKWFQGVNVNPTAAEIGAPTNSQGYVNHVNSIALCGFTDWRMPTVDELQSVVDYGLTYPGPVIQSDWFPNTPTHSAYWASTPFAVDPWYVWYVHFSDGFISSDYRDYLGRIRLVR